ncbi:PHD finger protein MALE MEIOCYTE DEATH 1-like [Chenopodium quinoa]|uniref:PHD finger protein MALE MEIOCYTE DEATH 1-like n=1 Tax=Chenopodium quinoa TaxID=63459 RepID=UPI000B76F882|nr:PHD finger protein MALE MEIOCYTE DEATH 1-like [Chenopodium quinoa]
MSLPILKACRKRKRAPKLFGLNTFCDPGCPIKPTGAFRDNIRVFLQECAEIEDYKIDSMLVWCTLLVQESGGVVLPLYTIEENVKNSKQPFCDHCRCCGWSHHYMSKRNYHVIIPLDSEWTKSLNSDVLELQTHLLHGLIHCNGFGHLVCINGIEGGSKYLCGREIMDLWDRICTNLHVRKISVEDTSRKRSMDLRILHSVAYGHPWFGRWGYRFSHGSFGVKAHHHQKAVEVLSSLNLDDLIGSLPKSNKSAHVKQIIYSYRNLSETRLITLRDLLKFMLTLKSKTPVKTKVALAHAAFPASSPQIEKFSPKISMSKRQLNTRAKPMVKCRKFQALVATMDSRWPKRRLEFTAEVIVNALKEYRGNKSSKKGMTRQEVRDAARAHIGDTGLLDYVLKSMNNVIVGDYIVRRRTDPVSRILEYTIHEVSEASPPKKSSREKASVEPVLALTEASGIDIYRDVCILYKQVILDQSDSNILGLSVRVLLDSKHFMKEWPFKDEDDQLLRFICQVLPTSSELEMELSKNLSPGEVIVLPLHASFGDLKVAVQQAFRDTYCIMERYTVTDIEDLGSLYDKEVIFGAVQSGSVVTVRGSGIDLKSEFRYEGGPDNWTVRCSCGATDDDGERMVSCDICEAWQHTRCTGIEDTEAVPPLFVCQNCCSSLMPPRVENISYPETETFHYITSPQPVEEPWMTLSVPQEVEESWMTFSY